MASFIPPPPFVETCAYDVGTNNTPASNSLSVGGIPGGMESDEEDWGGGAEFHFHRNYHYPPNDDVESAFDVYGKAALPTRKFDEKSSYSASMVAASAGSQTNTFVSSSNSQSESKDIRVAHSFDLTKSQMLDGGVEAVLEKAECPEYLPFFVENRIQLKHLLAMTEEDFEKLGVKEMGVRKNLSNAIKEIHRKPWHESNSIFNKDATTFNCLEATQLISSIHSHVTCMESSLNRFRRRRSAATIKNIKINVSDEKAGENLRKLITEARCSLKAIDCLQKEMQKTTDSINQLKDENSKSNCICNALKIDKFFPSYFKSILFAAFAVIAGGGFAAYCSTKRCCFSPKFA